LRKNHENQGFAALAAKDWLVEEKHNAGVSLMCRPLTKIPADPTTNPKATVRQTIPIPTRDSIHELFSFVTDTDLRIGMTVDEIMLREIYELNSLGHVARTVTIPPANECFDK
jgi:hypothetical protein